MRPDTDNFLFPLRRLSPPPPANSPPAKPAVGSDTLPEAGYARYRRKLSYRLCRMFLSFAAILFFSR